MKDKYVFPAPKNEDYWNGIELSDYFAAKAMQALIMLDNKQEDDPDAIAHRAYYFADVMIQNRAQSKEQPASSPQEGPRNKLKAEIAAIASEMEGHVMDYPMADFAKRLRQLSAV